MDAIKSNQNNLSSSQNQFHSQIYYIIFMLEILASIQNSRFWDRLTI